MSTSSSYGKYKKRRTTAVAKVPRILKSPNAVIVKRCVRYNFDLTTDFAGGFGFSPTNLWLNGVSSTAIDGASDITNLFDACRVVKVEMVLLPSCNSLDYANVVTTTRNIPYAYIAADKNDSTAPNQASILQFDNLHVTSMDHVIRYTCYPKTKSEGAIILSRSNWVLTGVDQPYFGIKLYIDNTTTNQANAGGSINFIIHYECKDSK